MSDISTLDAAQTAVLQEMMDGCQVKQSSRRVPNALRQQQPRINCATSWQILLFPKYTADKFRYVLATTMMQYS